MLGKPGALFSLLFYCYGWWADTVLTTPSDPDATVEKDKRFRQNQKRKWSKQQNEWGQACECHDSKRGKLKPHQREMWKRESLLPNTVSTPQASDATKLYSYRRIVCVKIVHIFNSKLTMLHALCRIVSLQDQTISLIINEISVAVQGNNIFPILNGKLVHVALHCEIAK